MCANKLYHKILAYAISNSKIYIEVANNPNLMGDWTELHPARAVYTKEAGSRVIIYAGSTLPTLVTL